MKTIRFNPISFAFDVVEKAHPDIQFDFHFAYLEDENIVPGDYNGPWGVTDFETSPVTVAIDPRLPLCAFAEILLHEVAHVVVGFDDGHDADGHGDKWQQEFDRLHELYHEMFALQFDPDTN